MTGCHYLFTGLRDNIWIRCANRITALGGSVYVIGRLGCNTNSCTEWRRKQGFIEARFKCIFKFWIHYLLHWHFPETVSVSSFPWQTGGDPANKKWTARWATLQQLIFKKLCIFKIRDEFVCSVYVLEPYQRSRWTSLVTSNTRCGSCRFFTLCAPPAPLSLLQYWTCNGRWR